jgi:hypothetical protein
MMWVVGGMEACKKNPTMRNPISKLVVKKEGMVVTMGHNGATEIQKTQIHR